MQIQAGLVYSHGSQGLILEKPFHFPHLERGADFPLCCSVVRVGEEMFAEGFP